MARGRGDEEDEAMLAYFLRNQQQQRGGGDDLMRLALAVLGMGPEREKLGAELGLKREELAAQERLRGQEEAGRQEMQRLAQTALGEERAHRKDILGFEREKLTAAQEKEEMELGKVFIADETIPWEQRREMLGTYSPKVRAKLELQLEQSQKQKAAELEKAVRTAYQERKPMEEFKNLLGLYEQYPGVVEKVPWGQLAQEAPVSQARRLTQGKGARGALWNMPGALMNLAGAGLEKVAQLAVGEDAPSFERIRYTKPFEKEWEGSVGYTGVPQAPPPEVAYGVRQPPVGPEWTYGTGTRVIPTDEAMRRYLGSLQ